MLCSHRSIDFSYLSERRYIWRVAVTSDIYSCDYSTYPPFFDTVALCSGRAVQRETRVGVGSTTGPLRSGHVQSPKKCKYRARERLTRVPTTWIRGPLFRAIKQFLRTRGIMFLLFSIGPDIEREVGGENARFRPHENGNGKGEKKGNGIENGARRSRESSAKLPGRRERTGESKRKWKLGR